MLRKYKKSQSSQDKRTQKKGSLWHMLFPYIPFAIPLLYLALDGGGGTMLYRAATVVVFGLFAAALVIVDLKKADTKPRHWQVITLLLIFVMCLSAALSNDKYTSLFGINTDFQGLFVQLSALAIGYMTAKRAGDINFWRVASVITGIICILSILADLPYLVTDYRESGLVLHATGMGLYAVLCLGINGSLICGRDVSRRWRMWHFGALLIVVATMLLSASRIGLLSGLMVVAVCFVLFRTHRALFALIFCLLILVSFFGGKILPASNRLTSSEKVGGGVSYRLDLYKWSLQQSRPTLIGAGPSQIASVLDSGETPAPPEIQKTLDKNFAFWYSHNQFIDQYIAYGIFGLLLFVALLSLSYLYMLGALIGMLDHHARQIVAIAITFHIVIAAHILVNTPSIELASLVWLAIFMPIRGLPYKKTYS